jgi:hypothetical protein
MLSDRFAPEWPKVRPMLDRLLQELSGADHLLPEAFSAVSSFKTDSPSAAKRHLQTAVGMPGIPWILYDTVAEVLKRLPHATRVFIARSVKIETASNHECLRITPDGRWQVSWEVDPDEKAIEDREVALDWYVPPDHDAVPIVPIPVIDFVASCVLLLREELALPACAVLSVALESALWDALSAIGVDRHSVQRTYRPTAWQIKRLSDKLVVTIAGADRDIRDLDSVVGEYGSPMNFELRRLQSGDSPTKIGIKFDVEVALADFFTSGEVEKSELIADRGLTNAIQKARSEGVVCLQAIAETLDNTLISLRNNTIHLPSRGSLHQPVPIPGSSELRTVDDLRASPQLVRNLLHWVAELINIVYANQLQVQNGEISE